MTMSGLLISRRNGVTSSWNPQHVATVRIGTWDVNLWTSSFIIPWRGRPVAIQAQKRLLHTQYPSQILITSFSGSLSKSSAQFFSLTYLLNYLTYLLTPWSRVLLEKLTGSVASQEIPRIYRTRKFITVLTSARHQFFLPRFKICCEPTEMLRLSVRPSIHIKRFEKLGDDFHEILHSIILRKLVDLFKFAIWEDIKFYSHQLMHFFIQLCNSLLSYIKIT